jgi:hypothetical protein
MTGDGTMMVQQQDNRPQGAEPLWKKGWTPWGTPCSVLVEDGKQLAAHAAEKRDCPLVRLASGDAAPSPRPCHDL